MVKPKMGKLLENSNIAFVDETQADRRYLGFAQNAPTIPKSKEKILHLAP